MSDNLDFTSVLIKKGLIKEEDVPKALSFAKEKGVSMEKALKAQGVSSNDIIEAKSEMLGVPFRVVGGGGKVPFEILKQIPEEAARHYKFAPIAVNNGTLEIGMANPNDIEAKEALQFITSKLNMPFDIFLVSEDDISHIFDEYKGLGGEATKVLSELESAIIETGEQEVPEDLLDNKGKKFVEEAPVTKMVAVILKHATQKMASDIHIEPVKNNTKVRFRVDGTLKTSLTLPKNVHDSIVSRIKILTGNMKLDEKRKPQDGRFATIIDNREIDFRVSTLPTFFGEKVVIRILDQEKGIKTLEEIGFSDQDIIKIRAGIKAPYGLILLTGPTGSGKTTTLYSMLTELDREKNNVISLEDPVEYTLQGVSQSQVKPEIGYSFASGLRSILRQDPDMIMVGEIRDKETAALAIQAALTGHLVFSTLHTNSASAVIPRLVDMGVDPFLIAPTLLLSIGQRLIKTMCPDSRKEVPVTGAIKDKIDKELSTFPEEIKQTITIPETIYQGIPSEKCPGGSSGRTGVFEVLSNSLELENIILTNPVETEVLKEARRQKMLTMREQALTKVFEGIVSLEEVNRL
jgi:type IV pilus assembly protein PilB